MRRPGCHGLVDVVLNQRESTSEKAVVHSHSYTLAQGSDVLKCSCMPLMIPFSPATRLACQHLSTWLQAWLIDFGHAYPSPTEEQREFEMTQLCFLLGEGHPSSRDSSMSGESQPCTCTLSSCSRCPHALALTYA